MMNYLKEEYRNAVREKRYADAMSAYERANNRELLKIRIDGHLPINMAIVDNNIEFVTFLLKKGINVNEAGRDDFTPLHKVAVTGHTHFIPLLLKHGGNIEVRRTMSHFTPFFCAYKEVEKSGCASDKVRVMRDFVRYGANAHTIVNSNPAIVYARKFGLDEIVDYLDGNYDYQADYFAGKLFKNKMPIQNLIVTGMRKETGRPLNMMVFSVRNEFNAAASYIKDHKIKPRLVDFAFRINDTFNVVEVLTQTDQLDQLLDRDFWQDDLQLMERFKKRYYGSAPVEFWDKFNLQIDMVLIEKQNRMSSPTPLRRRPKL